MGILGAYAVPHPPLILPCVGRGEERAIQNTIDAYQQVAERIVSHEPEVVVVSSPHAPLFRDCFYVAEGGYADDMGRFAAPDCAVDFPGDEELARELTQRASQAGLPMLHQALRGDVADHASLIPLWFARQAGLDSVCRVVRIGLSGLDFEAHRRLGVCIADALAALGRRAVFVASGDLSHKLKPEGPYGFAAEGPVFDREVTALFAEGRLAGLFEIDPAFANEAAECGLRSFQIMAGALGREGECSGVSFAPELLSYEGPFGVGYAVAAFEVSAEGDRGVFEQERRDESVDPLVALARASVEGFVRTGRQIARPYGLPRELTETQAGVFVSLHSRGELRGCIGTIAPTCFCVADEIIRNGVSAASQDPRFPPVREDELDFLSYSVDVLAQPEPISSQSELDPARFGVIVTKGWRRGLLLPNLDGVDTVEAQLAIAKGKAGIGPDEDGVSLERFEVTRHVAGGQARRG